MNKIIIYLLLAGFTLMAVSCKKESEADKLRAQHLKHLENSPFQKISHLSKGERKELGIPNSKYEERMWELTMNPALGKPTPGNLFDIQKNLESNHGNRSTPGDVINAWVERGPNNVGGRTKAILFDPNDPTHKRVFAGGISGGLWVNNDITNASSAWSLIDIPENVAVSSISVDANNSNIFYLGTGESYTSGSVNGNGVWKSVDGGATWQHIFGGITGATTFETNATLQINSPANVAGDYDAIRSSFGPQDFNVTADMAIVNDGTATPTLGCFALTNASEISGKIAVIDRGTCLFVEKIRFAQAAGAVAVVMINNVDGNPIIMGGDGDLTDIVIPAVMITKSEGTAIKTAIASGTVNGRISSNDVLVSGAYLVPGQTHINDIITRNNGGTTEIFAAVGDSYYSDASSATVMGTGFQGVYKSSDGGLTWTKLFLPDTVSGYPTTPQDLEIGADNSVWMTTTRSTWFGIEGAGQVFNSTDGSAFTLKHTVANGKRTEIAVSKTNPTKAYLLVDMNVTTAPVAIYKTTDGFATVTSAALPNDSTSFIPDNDFTNGQAFYDLAIEVDPNNDNTVFVGGIDWFKSTNAGTSWSQLTAAYSGGTGSPIHADQHNIIFADSNTILIACDGGLAYSSNGGSTFAHRNTNYNTLQFYHMGVAPTTNYTGDYFLAGAQDNGSQLFQNAPAGIGSSTEAYGADGGYCFFDQDGTDKYYITNIYYNNAIYLYNYNTSALRLINSESAENGEFITPQTLDSQNNLLFSNYTYYDAANSANNIYRLRRYKNLLSGTVQKLPMTGFTRSVSALKASPFTAVGTSVLFAGQDDGKLFRIDNAAANTTAFTLVNISGTGFVGSISDIEFGASQNEIYVTMFNYGVGSIWYTTDGGTTWVQKEGNLPDMPVNCILRNPLRPEQVIIGTDLGVWYTLDFNATEPVWYRGDNGMKSVKVTSLELRNDNKVFASTFGRGIFSGQFTADDGTAGVSNEVVSTVTAYPNPATDNITIKSKVTLNQPIVMLFDVTGRIVSQQNFKSSTDVLKMDTSKLQSGQYVAKVLADNKTYSTKFIVK